jgi:hypothetical protein
MTLNVFDLDFEVKLGVASGNVYLYFYSCLTSITIYKQKCTHVMEDCFVYELTSVFSARIGLVAFFCCLYYSKNISIYFNP